MIKPEKTAHNRMIQRPNKLKYKALEKNTYYCVVRLSPKTQSKIWGGLFAIKENFIVFRNLYILIPNHYVIYLKLI